MVGKYVHLLPSLVLMNKIHLIPSHSNDYSNSILNFNPDLKPNIDSNPNPDPKVEDKDAHRQIFY